VISILSIDANEEGQLIHRLIFGEYSSEILKSLSTASKGIEDAVDPKEHEYYHTLHTLQRLEEQNPDEFSRFILKIQSVQGLNDLDFTIRCRLIYLFVASTIDWKDTRTRKLGVHDAVWERAFASSPPLDLDFQDLLDSIKSFKPSPELASSWGLVFSHALRHPSARDQAKAEIVRGAGSKIRKRKKPNS